MGFQSRLPITIVADALVGSHHVLANSIRADAASSRALVDVLAGLFIRRKLVSWRTHAPVRPVGVDAPPAATQPGSLVAFVDVCQFVDVRL